MSAPPTPIPQQWDPRSVLDIYPAHGPLTCSGKAKQGTRRCGWELPEETENQIETVLAQIAALQPGEAMRRGFLRSLAVLALCEGRKNEIFNGHRGQLNRLVEKWNDVVTQAFPEERHLFPVQISPVYTTAPQRERIPGQQSAGSPLELSYDYLSRPPVTRLSNSSESVSKPEQSSVQICVTASAPAPLETSQEQTETAYHSNHRQYSQDGSMILETTPLISHGGCEKPYPEPRGFLRRVLGCFSC
ncbi:hypothetical protein EG327_006492 [Venturia inaequalis]|uniref:Uncharacterized protein n=1 Tax=Venturia inaequalis TaxID=5025 RepID=A0A8H3V099_VENIN|nr:hypothetical protein EG327_006492 [Venturia inaequalis]